MTDEKKEDVGDIMTDEKKENIDVVPKSSCFWIKDSKSNPSASLTFVTVAFIVTTLAFIAGVIQKVGPVEFRAFDSTACAAYLTPLLALYFSRRMTDAKWGNQNLPSPTNPMIVQTDTPRE